MAAKRERKERLWCYIGPSLKRRFRRCTLYVGMRSGRALTDNLMVVALIDAFVRDTEADPGYVQCADAIARAEAMAADANT